ncbi:hypothetical protein MRX96_017883 [Rhipicephalus microplus]
MPLYRRLEPFEKTGPPGPSARSKLTCATQIFRRLLDLLKPAKPHPKTLSELLPTLCSHFRPPSSTLMGRFRFNNRSHQEGESLGQFIAALRGLASTCAFGDQVDSLLRDRFVCGINNPGMQTRLLQLPDPSLDDVVKAALAIDSTTKNASEITRAASTEAVGSKMMARGEVPAAVPEPTGVLMLEHAYLEVISRSAVSQATSRDQVLSQVVKAVSREKKLVQQPYSYKAAELSLQQSCVL